MNEPLSDDAWKPCAAGTLREQGARWKSKQSRQRIVSLGYLSLGAAVAVAASCVLIVYSIVPTNEGSPSIIPAGVQVSSVALSCREVNDACDSFLEGQGTPEYREQVRKHLTYCAPCQAHYRQRAEQLGVEFLVLTLPATAQESVASNGF